MKSPHYAPVSIPLSVPPS